MTAPVEQKNWHIVRQVIGYHRYDPPAELELLNRIWALQRPLTNHFAPQQKLASKTRTGATYDAAKTPFQRVLDDPGWSPKPGFTWRTPSHALGPALCLYARLVGLRSLPGRPTGPGDE